MAVEPEDREFRASLCLYEETLANSRWGLQQHFILAPLKPAKPELTENTVNIIYLSKHLVDVICSFVKHSEYYQFCYDGYYLPQPILTLVK